MVHWELEIDWPLRSVTRFKAGYSWCVLVPTLVREEQSLDLSSLWLSRYLFSSSHWQQLSECSLLIGFVSLKCAGQGGGGPGLPAVEPSLLEFLHLVAWAWVKPPEICCSLMRALEEEGWPPLSPKGRSDWKMGQRGLGAVQGHLLPWQ